MHWPHPAICRNPQCGFVEAEDSMDGNFAPDVRTSLRRGSSSFTSSCAKRSPVGKSAIGAAKVHHDGLLLGSSFNRASSSFTGIDRALRMCPALHSCSGRTSSMPVENWAAVILLVQSVPEKVSQSRFDYLPIHDSINSQAAPELTSSRALHCSVTGFHRPRF